MGTPSLLLRTLLAFALLVGGLPAPAMAVPIQDEATMATPCHGMDAPDTMAEKESPAPGCCIGLDCQCDCLEHMPVVVLGSPPLATPRFAGMAQASRALERHNWLPSTQLRPPIA